MSRNKGYGYLFPRSALPRRRRRVTLTFSDHDGDVNAQKGY